MENMKSIIVSELQGKEAWYTKQSNQLSLPIKMIVKLEWT